MGMEERWSSALRRHLHLHESTILRRAGPNAIHRSRVRVRRHRRGRRPPQPGSYTNLTLPTTADEW